MVAVNWASRYDSETLPSKRGLEINEGGSDVSDRSGLHGFPFDWTPSTTTHATTNDFSDVIDLSSYTDWSPACWGYSSSVRVWQQPRYARQAPYECRKCKVADHARVLTLPAYPQQSGTTACLLSSQFCPDFLPRKQPVQQRCSAQSCSVTLGKRLEHGHVKRNAWAENLAGSQPPSGSLAMFCLLLSCSWP